MRHHRAAYWSRCTRPGLARCTGARPPERRPRWRTPRGSRHMAGRRVPITRRAHARRRPWVSTSPDLRMLLDTSHGEEARRRYRRPKTRVCPRALLMRTARQTRSYGVTEAHNKGHPGGRRGRGDENLTWEAGENGKPPRPRRAPRSAPIRFLKEKLARAASTNGCRWFHKQWMRSVRGADASRRPSDLRSLIYRRTSRCAEYYWGKSETGTPDCEEDPAGVPELKWIRLGRGEMQPEGGAATATAQLRASRSRGRQARSRRGWHREARRKKSEWASRRPTTWRRSSARSRSRVEEVNIANPALTGRRAALEVDSKSPAPGAPIGDANSGG